VRPTRHLPIIASLALLLAFAVSASATAAPSATLHTSLKPERLGGNTTLGFGFNITDGKGRIPPPLTAFELRYPVQLGFAVSELGLDTCSEKTFEIQGAKRCPTNSIMGRGTALGEISVEGETVQERVSVTVARSTNENSHLELLFLTEGHDPILNFVAFKGTLSAANPPFGGRVTADIPLLETYPEGPDISVVSFASTIGPEHLHYHERSHGHVISYKPRGIALPNKCPHGGFLFSATFRFQDHTHTRATSTVRCPVKR
jgi:hypothetical protein